MVQKRVIINMNTKVKKKWLKALRSRKYKQGKNLLRKDDEYCCLGVLCDLHSQEHRNVWKPGTKQHPENCYTYIEGWAMLPEVVRLWSGLNESVPIVEYQEKETNLGELNDGGISFEEISQIIEAQL